MLEFMENKFTLEIVHDKDVNEPFFLKFHYSGDKEILELVFTDFDNGEKLIYSELTNNAVSGLPTKNLIKRIVAGSKKRGRWIFSTKRDINSSRSIECSEYNVQSLFLEHEKICFKSKKQANIACESIEELLNTRLESVLVQYNKFLAYQSSIKSKQWLNERDKLNDLLRGKEATFNQVELRGSLYDLEWSALQKLSNEIMYFSYETLRSISNEMINSHGEPGDSDILLYYKLILEIGEDFHNLPLSIMTVESILAAAENLTSSIISLIVVNQLLGKSFNPRIEQIKEIINKYIPSYEMQVV